MQHLCSEQKTLNACERYVRFAERIRCKNTNSEDFGIVVCMNAEMSRQLVKSKRVTSDTSFKRVRGWEEFELEVWDSRANRCTYANASKSIHIS